MDQSGFKNTTLEREGYQDRALRIANIFKRKFRNLGGNNEQTQHNISIYRSVPHLSTKRMGQLPGFNRHRILYVLVNGEPRRITFCNEKRHDQRRA